MKIKTFLSLLLLLTFLVSCEDSVRPGAKLLRVYEQSAVQEDYPLVKFGDALVFHFNRSASDREDVIDDEFSEEFLIQIGTDQDSFNYSSNDLALYNLPIIYRQYCFCGGFNQVLMNVFDISGERKSNGDWRLEGDVTLTLQYVNEETQEVVNEWTKEINLTGLFVKSSRPS